MSVRLVLGSASPARLATLRSAGVEPLVVVSGVDEDATLAAAADRYGDLLPADAALVLARAKAEDVATRIRAEHTGDLVVVGCDSLFEQDGQAYGKPRDVEDARSRWKRMSGSCGLLHTGHWVIDLRDPAAGGTGATFGETVTTEVSFAEVTGEEVAAYIATGEPLVCAGAFTIDSYGGAFVTGVRGDHHNVVGISLSALRRMLAQLSISWPELWAR